MSRQDRAARIRARKLAGLAAPLDAVKRRDAAVLAEIQNQIQAIDDKIVALEAEMAAAVMGFDPSDLNAAAALADWRAASKLKIARWAEEREALRPDWEAARETLLRSNGEAEAVKRLTKG